MLSLAPVLGVPASWDGVLCNLFCFAGFKVDIIRSKQVSAIKPLGIMLFTIYIFMYVNGQIRRNQLNSMSDTLSLRNSVILVIKQ